jgi:hypothetical protein
MSKRKNFVTTKFIVVIHLLFVYTNYREKMARKFKKLKLLTARLL